MTPSVIKLLWSSCRGNLKQESQVLNCLPVEGAYADTQLAANVWIADNRLNALDRVLSLAVTEFQSLHIEPLPVEKILLLTTLVLGDDYPCTFDL